MCGDLRIEQVALSAPRSVPVPMNETNTEPWIDVRIGMKNYSASKTYHVIAGFRALKYDVETRTLEVICGEPVRSLPIRHIALPEVVPVLPEEDATISFELPLRIKVLPVGKRLTAGVEIIDVSDVERVTCTVQFSDVPFHPTAGSADEISRELAGWGERTEATFRVRVGTEGTADTEDDRKKRGRADGERG
jgi:hypothetical protein